MKRNKSRISDFIIFISFACSVLLLILVIALQSYHVITKPYGLMAVAATGTLRVSVLRAGVIIKDGVFVGTVGDLLNVSSGEKVKTNQNIGITSSGDIIRSPEDGVVFIDFREPIISSIEEAIDIFNFGSFPKEKNCLIMVSGENYKVVIKSLPWDVELGETIELNSIYKNSSYKLKVIDLKTINDNNYIVLEGDNYSLELLELPWHLFMIESNLIEGIIVSEGYLKNENNKWFVKLLSRGKTITQEVEVLGSRGSTYIINGIDSNAYLLPWRLF